MSTAESSPNPAAGAPSLTPREVFARAWPLFKHSLPVCLPLAVVGVAAGATPGAEAAASPEGRGLTHGAEWWGVTCASIVLTLICYGAVLRQQLALATGTRAAVMDAVRGAALDLPAVVPLLLLLVVPLLPAMILTATAGFGLPAALLTAVALLLLVYAWLAWPAIVDRGMPPWTALGTSVAIVRGRWRDFAALLGTLIAGVLVFVLLVGIFIGVIMGLAGQSTPTAAGLAFSRWLMALILAVPVVHAGAVTVTIWRAVSGAPASRGGAGPRPVA